METEHNTFGQKLRVIRERAGLSLASLGKAVGCSAPKLYKIEHGKLKKEIPPYFVKKLCDALRLSGPEESKLFAMAGYKRPSEGDVQRIVEMVEETLQDRDFSDSAEDLVAEVEGFIRSWRLSRKARNRDVRKVVIAAAGWQPRLLSVNRYERTLLPAIDEAVRANVSEVILIVPPGTPDLQVLRATFRSMTVRKVVQQEPLGLGNAVLTAHVYVKDEPFAVLLADEIDESRNTLRDLIEAYRKVRKPLVAVDSTVTDEVAVSRYFGFAKLASPVHSNVFTFESELVEKPQGGTPPEMMRIAGRYILTPEILQALYTTGKTERAPLKHDLTTAINQLWRASHSVLAFRLRKSLLSIAPYRQMIETMDNRKVFSAQTYEARRVGR